MASNKPELTEAGDTIKKSSCNSNSGISAIAWQGCSAGKATTMVSVSRICMFKSAGVTCGGRTIAMSSSSRCKRSSKISELASDNCNWILGYCCWYSRITLRSSGCIMAVPV